MQGTVFTDGNNCPKESRKPKEDIMLPFWPNPLVSSRHIWKLAKDKQRRSSSSKGVTSEESMPICSVVVF